MDTILKISQILTPVVLALAGYFISRNLAKQAHSNVISSSFNTRWTTLFMDKAITFNGLVTTIITSLNWISGQPTSKTQALLDELSPVVRKLQAAEYDFRVYADLVDNTNEIKETASGIFKRTAKLLKDLEGPINETEALQKTFIKQLKEIHKSAIDLKK